MTGDRRVGWMIAALTPIFTHAAAANLPIRPITLATGPNYSMVVSGTLTTAGSAITGWNATVTEANRIAHYAPGNTANMSYGPMSCDGARLMVATSPDGSQDGGLLFFRSPNPYQDVGVALADFTGMNAGGGQAMYMYGGAFDFVALNQPNNSSYVVATRASGNVYNLTPIAFYGGVQVTGTVTTDGTVGPFAPNHILSWDVNVDQVTHDLFSNSNSTLEATLVAPSETAVTVTNPGGFLNLRKGYIGGELYALSLADFSSQAPPGGQAGYYHGPLGTYLVSLNAPIGSWPVTEPGISAVGTLEPIVPLRLAPNPATSGLSVAYTLPVAGRVIADLFDPTGRRLRRLFDSTQEIGRHEFLADVRDLTPGVYFCRLETAGHVVTRKVVVQK